MDYHSFSNILLYNPLSPNNKTLYSNLWIINAPEYNLGVKFSSSFLGMYKLSILSIWINFFSVWLMVIEINLWFLSDYLAHEPYNEKSVSTYFPISVEHILQYMLASLLSSLFFSKSQFNN